MIAYADTGFLVSLYGEDDNSTAATVLVQNKPVFVLSSLNEVEFINAVELRIFRKEWSREEAQTVRNLFSQHQASGILRVQPLAPAVWEKALSLSRHYSAKFGTRTLDILHVATALVVGADIFYTFDERQRKLARSERIKILPN